MDPWGKWERARNTERERECVNGTYKIFDGVKKEEDKEKMQCEQEEGGGGWG